MNLFDTDAYPKSDRPGRCLGCTKAFVAVTGPAAYRHQYRSMAGRAWPGAISLNLHRDFDSLGLNADNAPERATLCLVCAVDYMTEFNARLSRRRSGADNERPDPSSRGTSLQPHSSDSGER